MGSYIVVFEKTEKAGAYAGIRTWTSFDSKEHFEAWFSQLSNPGYETVLTEGVTDAEAIALTKATPVTCYIRAYKFECTDARSGILDTELFLAKCSTLVYLVPASEKAALFKLILDSLLF